MFELPHRQEIKNNAGVTPRGVYQHLRSVLRGFIASGTLYGVSIYSSDGAYSVLFFLKAVVGQIVRQADVKHHAFYIQSSLE